VTSSIIAAVPSELAASATLSELAELRHAAKASTTSWWFPMVFFGLVAIGGGVLDTASGDLQLAWWAGSVTAASVLTWLFYRHRSASQGAVSKHHRFWLLWMPLSAAAFTAPLVAPPGAEAASAWGVVAFGYLLTGWLARSARVGVVGALLMTVVVLVMVASASSAASDIACGIVLIGSGGLARLAEGAR
jgi:hypothetical protein